MGGKETWICDYGKTDLSKNRKIIKKPNNMEKLYCVTTPTDSVCEYFEERDNAIAFIVDEFAMA